MKNPASFIFLFCLSHVLGLPWPSCSSLDVPFPSSREATIALRSLSPDKEPRKGGISKLITVSGSTLSVWDYLPWLLHSLYQTEPQHLCPFCTKNPSLCFRRWSADEARILRVSVNSFLDHLSLVMETMEMFGPPVAVWCITSDSGLCFWCLELTEVLQTGLKFD